MGASEAPQGGGSEERKPRAEIFRAVKKSGLRQPSAVLTPRTTILYSANPLVPFCAGLDTDDRPVAKRLFLCPRKFEPKSATDTPFALEPNPSPHPFNHQLCDSQADSCSFALGNHWI